MKRAASHVRPRWRVSHHRVAGCARAPARATHFRPIYDCTSRWCRAGILPGDFCLACCSRKDQHLWFPYAMFAVTTLTIGLCVGLLGNTGHRRVGPVLAAHARVASPTPSLVRASGTSWMPFFLRVRHLFLDPAPSLFLFLCGAMAPLLLFWRDLQVPSGAASGPLPCSGEPSNSPFLLEPPSGLCLIFLYPLMSAVPLDVHLFENAPV